MWTKDNMKENKKDKILRKNYLQHTEKKKQLIPKDFDYYFLIGRKSQI